MVKYLRLLWVLVITVAVAELPTQGFAKEDKTDEAEAAKTDEACEDSADKDEKAECDKVKKKKKKKRKKRDCVPSGSRISRC